MYTCIVVLYYILKDSVLNSSSNLYVPNFILCVTASREEDAIRTLAPNPLTISFTSPSVSTAQSPVQVKFQTTEERGDVRNEDVAGGGEVVDHKSREKRGLPLPGAGLKANTSRAVGRLTNIALALTKVTPTERTRVASRIPSVCSCFSILPTHSLTLLHTTLL